jgi:hypothetical protein
MLPMLRQRRDLIVVRKKGADALCEDLVFSLSGKKVPDQTDRAHEAPRQKDPAGAASLQ